MNIPTVAFDIDDVLSTNVKDFVAFSNSKWGTNLTDDDYDEDWARLWGVSKEEALRRSRLYHESGYIGTYGHHAEALPVLKKLKKHFKLVIVTSRRKVLMRETAEWLDNYFEGIFEEIHYAGIWDDEAEGAVHATKADICEQVGADYLVDDQPKHCIGANQAGIKAVLFGDYGWNRGIEVPASIKRVATWQELERYFDEISGKQF